MAAEPPGNDEDLKENQVLKKQISDLRTELKNLKEEAKCYCKKLKKVEYEKENAEGHVINLKRDLDALRKEVYDERKKWKEEKEELSKACQREEHSNPSQHQPFPLNSHLHSDVNDSKDIKAVLEEAASQAMSQSGFVYDERTGLYYDWNSGLYYDPNSCLYYNNQTGIYYMYDEASKSYLFHSQIELPPEENTNGKSNHEDDKPLKKKQKPKRTKPTAIKVKSSSDEESSSGEIISTDDEDDEYDDADNDDDDDDDDSGDEESIHKVAPCVRAIVTESDKMKIGTLFVITCTGGTLGREKDVGHGIQIPDVAISKHHCKISYDQERKQYFIIDLASRNGSCLNGQQLGQGNAEESQPCVLTHEDRLTVGGTTLAFHIHQGNETCDDCEPGLVQAKLSTTTRDEFSVCDTNSAESSEDKRKKLLRNLKKAYGLEKEAYEEDIKIPNKRKYRDRADLRRVKVGSDVPVQLPDAPPASVHRPIGTENKGRKMLEKMGWRDGEGLGKEGSGLKEPVTAGIHDKLRGLGSGTVRSIDSVNSSPTTSSIMRSKARERYEKILTSDAQTADTPIFTKKETVFVPQTTKE